MKEIRIPAEVSSSYHQNSMKNSNSSPMILEDGSLITDISFGAHETEENKALENTPKDINTTALNGLRGILSIYVKCPYNKEHEIMIFWVSIVCLYGIDIRIGVAFEHRAECLVYTMSRH